MDGAESQQHQREAARALAGQAHRVQRVDGGWRRRELVRRLSRGRYGRCRAWPHIPEVDSPWQDTVAAERDGWRTRAANLPGEGDHAFGVDYRICRRCRLGWVENPYTLDHLQRCGLASAGLAALRREHPGLSWHTLGGHFRDSWDFWAAVGDGVPGGYEQRQVCPHVPRG